MRLFETIRLLSGDPSLREDVADASNAALKAVTCALSVVEEACLTIASELKGIRDGSPHFRDDSPEETLTLAFEKLACAKKAIQCLVEGGGFHVE
ncbi:MAG TPA: hypothetical protein PKW29_13080 [Clostridia bacterium]|nr:hypothetical protein [Clostridia bacterium]